MTETTTPETAVWTAEPAVIDGELEYGAAVGHLDDTPDDAISVVVGGRAAVLSPRAAVQLAAILTELAAAERR